VDVKVIIQSRELTKEEVQLLLQGVRDCETKHFPDKQISIWLEVPDMSTGECTEILTSIKPPFKYGPIIGIKGEPEIKR